MDKTVGHVYNIIQQFGQLAQITMANIQARRVLLRCIQTNAKLAQAVATLPKAQERRKKFGASGRLDTCKQNISNLSGK